MIKKTKQIHPTIEDVGKRVQWRGRTQKGYITIINPESTWTNVAWDWECYTNPPIDKHGKKQYPVWGYVLLEELIILDDQKDEASDEQG